MNDLTTRQHVLLAWKELKEEARRAATACDFKKAETLLLEGYEVAREMFGPDHGEVGLVLLQLLDITEKQGKKELASQYSAEIQRIVAIYKQAAEE